MCVNPHKADLSGSGEGGPSTREVTCLSMGENYVKLLSVIHTIVNQLLGNWSLSKHRFFSLPHLH